MSCSEIYTVTSNRCKFAQQNDPQCNCETVSVSQYSPGVVEDNEILIRQIYSTHIDEETGRVNTVAFTDAQDKGMSVNRKTYSSIEELNKKVQYKLMSDEKRGKGKGFEGVIYATCHDIRAIKTNDGLKAFCVYDTGNKNDISHADICQATSSRVYGSKMRLKLREIFSDTPITLDILFTN